MKNTPLGAFLALLLALPAASAGPTVRTGRLAPTALPVGGPALGVSGANLAMAPALSLSAPALSASLAPTPALPAPAAAPLAAAPLAAPLLAPTAPAPRAASPAVDAKAPALAPAFAAAADAPELAGARAAALGAAAAQDGLRAGSAAAARSAGVSVFDGALGAAAHAPEVPGAPGAPRRLAPPTEREVADAFRAARPGSTAVDFFTPREFAAAAADLTMQYTFASKGFLESVAANIPFGDRNGRAFLAALTGLVAAHDASDPASRRYSELLGRYYAMLDAGQDQMQSVMSLFMGRGREQPHMPPAPRGVAGEYWDMAAGINGGRYVRRDEVDRTTPYVMFDLSPFVAAYIRESAALAGKSNVTTREEDLLRIAKPARPLAVLRTKNAIAYVDGFERKLEEMADWLAPGGQLVIQTDPNPYQRVGVIEKHGPLVERLLAQGWSLSYGFAGGAGELGRYGYDTLILTRPKGAAAAAEPGAWLSYQNAVRYANRALGF